VLGLVKATDPDGNKIFHVVDWRPLCPACKHKEARTKKEVLSCKHGNYSALDFRSRSDQDRVEALLAPFGGYEQEMLNMRVGDMSEPFFQDWQLDRFFATPTADLREEAPLVILACDPGGGGTGPSDTAIVGLAPSRYAPPRSMTQFEDVPWRHATVDQRYWVVRRPVTFLVSHHTRSPRIFVGDRSRSLASGPFHVVGPGGSCPVRHKSQRSA